MKSSKKSNTDVLEVEAEEMLPEVPLEKVIENTLVKANVTDQVIASLKERYGNMRLANIDDKETYLDIKEARKEVRKVGIITEKLCKKGREDAVAIQRKWLAKEKEILGKIAEVEDPLNAEIEKFDNEVERKELEESKRKEGVYMSRQSTLLKMGAVYDNGNFVLNHISYEVELLRQCDEDTWNDTILPKYRKVFEEIESEKVAEEHKRKEELAKQKKEREEFELQQKKFREEQELFAKQQAELRQQKEDHERQQRLEQDRKDAEEKKRVQNLVTARRNMLYQIGVGINPEIDAEVFNEVKINLNDLYNIPDVEWDITLERIAGIIGVYREKEKQKRESEIAQQKQEAIDKAIADQKLKEQQEQQRKEEGLAQANDKTKWVSFIAQVKLIPHSEMKSPKYRRMQAQAKEKIEEILSL